MADKSIRSWHHIRNAAQLILAAKQLAFELEMAKVDPETVVVDTAGFTGEIWFRLHRRTLTDGSKVYDLVTP